jgi:hypothetical protein
VADAARVAAAWPLVDGDETEVKSGKAQEHRAAQRRASAEAQRATSVERLAVSASLAMVELLEHPGEPANGGIGDARGG